MKEILIYLRNTGEHTPAANYGVRLAATLSAWVTGACVYPAPAYLAPAYEPELLAAILDNSRQLELAAIQAREPFLEWAASLGVAHTEWIIAEGDPPSALAQAAIRHDLLVVDHPVEPEDMISDVPAIVLKAGVPCIVTPHHGHHFGPIGRIAVGWNGSPEAMRALHSALPFVQDKDVLLMSGELREADRGTVWRTPFDVCEYLRRRGARVEECAITASPSNAGGALLEEAMHFRADLLVMGAYGRSRFSEWLLGGATRYALAWAEMPLLLQH